MSGVGKRMAVLSDGELKQVYGLPKFTEEQRNTYFALNPSEKQEVAKLRSVHTKTLFILQLGYFKAKKMFFVFDSDEVKSDLSHILNRYYPEQDGIATETVLPYYVRNDHQRRILRLTSYQRASAQTRGELVQKAATLVKIHTKPLYVFRELLIHLEKRRIVIPGYSVLQSIIAKALTDERQRLEVATNTHLNTQDKSVLSRLLTGGDTLYELTLLKRSPRILVFMKPALKLLDSRDCKRCSRRLNKSCRNWVFPMKTSNITHP